MTASCPEELETLLEDAVLLRDAAAVAALFEDGGTLVTDGDCVRGQTCAAQWLAQRDYVAAVRSVAVIGGVAVVVGAHAVNVSRRGPDHQWRLVVVVAQSQR